MQYAELALGQNPATQKGTIRLSVNGKVIFSEDIVSSALTILEIPDNLGGLSFRSITGLLYQLQFSVHSVASAFHAIYQEYALSCAASDVENALEVQRVDPSVPMVDLVDLSEPSKTIEASSPVVHKHEASEEPEAVLIDFTMDDDTLDHAQSSALQDMQLLMGAPALLELMDEPAFVMQIYERVQDHSRGKIGVMLDAWARQTGATAEELKTCGKAVVGGLGQSIFSQKPQIVETMTEEKLIHMTRRLVEEVLSESATFANFGSHEGLWRHEAIRRATNNVLQQFRRRNESPRKIYPINELLRLSDPSLEVPSDLKYTEFLPHTKVRDAGSTRTILGVMTNNMKGGRSPERRSVFNAASPCFVPRVSGGVTVTAAAAVEAQATMQKAEGDRSSPCTSPKRKPQRTPSPNKPLVRASTKLGLNGGLAASRFASAP